MRAGVHLNLQLTVCMGEQLARFNCGALASSKRTHGHIAVFGKCVCAVRCAGVLLLCSENAAKGEKRPSLARALLGRSCFLRHLPFINMGCLSSSSKADR